MTRPYTGTSDGIASGARPGLLEFVKQIESKTDRALWNNGTWGVRKMRGKEDLSVHATGRAVDLSYRRMADGRGKPQGRRHAQTLLHWLTQNADALGIEMMIDYAVPKYGRGYRCDRGGWKTYTKKTVTGGGSFSSDWVHIELSPRMADDPAAVAKVLEGLDPALFRAAVNG